MTLQDVYDQMLADCTSPVDCQSMDDDQMFEHMARCQQGVIATIAPMHQLRETLVTTLSLQDQLHVRPLIPSPFVSPTTLYVLDADPTFSFTNKPVSPISDIQPGEFHKNRFGLNGSVVRWKSCEHALIRVYDLVCLNRIFPTYETVIVSTRLLKNHDYFTRQLNHVS